MNPPMSFQEKVPLKLLTAHFTNKRLQVVLGFRLFPNRQNPEPSVLKANPLPLGSGRTDALPCMNSHMFPQVLCCGKRLTAHPTNKRLCLRVNFLMLFEVESCGKRFTANITDVRFHPTVNLPVILQVRWRRKSFAAHVTNICFDTCMN